MEEEVPRNSVVAFTVVQLALLCGLCRYYINSFLTFSCGECGDHSSDHHNRHTEYKKFPHEFFPPSKELHIGGESSSFKHL